MAKKLTSNQAFYRKGLLAKIHQAPLYKQMDEDTYRDMLETHFKTRSAANLSINQLIVLLDYLSNKTAQPIERITPAQQRHILNAWQQKARTPSTKALRQFIEKRFKKTVIGVQALTKKEAGGLINALNRMEISR